MSKLNLNTVVNIAMIFGLSVTSGYTLKYLKSKNDNRKLNIDLKKYRQYYNLYDSWIRQKKEGENLEAFFLRNNYKDIAIYGMGNIGRRLLEELEGSEINVKYIVDKNANVNFSDLNIIEDITAIDDVDVVVVTAMFDYANIERKILSEMQLVVVSIEDVVGEHLK